MKGLKVYVQAELRDKNGRFIRRTRQYLAHSYVRQLIDVLQGLFGALNYTILDTGNTSRVTDNSYGAGQNDILRCDSASANKLYGIQVGTDNTAVAISQYHLIAQIDEGASSGKLNHGSTSLTSVAIVGTSAKFTIARTLTNNSGADIEVKEVGLVLAIYDNASTIRYIMVDRTLLDFTITNGTSGTVTYTISVTI